MDNLQTDSLLPAKVYRYLEDCTKQAGLEKFVSFFTPGNYPVMQLGQLNRSTGSRKKNGFTNIQENGG